MSSLKYRNEIKYLISENELQVLKRELDSFMTIDKNAVNGQYLISSLYFDDYFNNGYYDVDDGNGEKDKFRIRIYDCDDGFIRLEHKIKKNNMTAKRSCLLDKDSAEIMIHGGYLRDIATQDEVLKELTYRIMSERYKPVIIVEYERIPYVYKNGNVRITLDTNIRSSTDIHSFLGHYKKKMPILPLGKELLEVKYDGFLPTFIYDCLNDLNLQQISFSKYYLCRKYNVKGGLLL